MDPSRGHHPVRRGIADLSVVVVVRSVLYI